MTLSRHPQGKLFAELATQQFNSGLTLSQILLTVKTMRQVLMQLIDEVIIAERIKLRAHQRLLCFTDLLEQQLLDNWQRHDSDQHTRNLQQRSQQLQREKNSYRHIFESTSNLVLLTDSNGTIVELNPQARIFSPAALPSAIFVANCSTARGTRFSSYWKSCRRARSMKSPCSATSITTCSTCSCRH